MCGDWGLGIGDWGLGIGDWAQSPIPNPQSPIPNPHNELNKIKISINNKILLYIIFINYHNAINVNKIND